MSQQTEGQPAHPSAGCCPYYHQAIELIGKRWTGAILQTLMAGPLRFSEISGAIPDLSDRLLSQRMKELETHGLVGRQVDSGPPVRVRYELSPMGHELAPALSEIGAWARRWLEGEVGEVTDPAAAPVDSPAAAQLL
jgi:DNA-binding HxlR family transcriptional regulator